MAVNMMGHINRYCGNKEEAKKNWFQVISMMEEEGYESSMPPIYMNIVNVVFDENPAEADSLLNIAKSIAEKYSPERVFDIQTRKTLNCYNLGDMEGFLEGYKAYKEGEAKGMSSVHGRSLEVYSQAYLGNTDKAIDMARKELGDESEEVIPLLYAKAGKWQEAYEALKQEMNANDSIDNVVLINSMQGISDEIKVYEAEHQAARNKLYGLTAVILLLILLIVALVYIVQSRRRHFRQLKKAYDHALESDKMKTAFIQNVSHEVRTPLNIISGFAQVIANEDFEADAKEREDISQMMQKNTNLITALIDEMLVLSLNDTTEGVKKEDHIIVNDLLRDFLQESESSLSPDTELKFESLLADNFKILTNENMLKSIVKALIDNAAKNTDKGSITLKTQADEQHLTLTVEDTGCGIPPQEAEHIFERFVKLDTFKEGIGLGLPLCRSLAEKLGGSVRLDTSYQGGARFVVTIPLA